MADFFNSSGFDTYYLGKTKYEGKHNLLKDFYYVWYDYAGYGLATCFRPAVKSSWKDATLKKSMKIRLQGMGYSAAAITSLFKALTEWNSAN